MRNLLLTGVAGLAAVALIGTSASAQQVGQADPSFRPQAQEQPRDVTNQDIVDKAELDVVTRKRAKGKQGNSAVAATAADIVAGSPLHDNAGVPIGTVDRLDADGVVVATTVGRVKVPLESFGKNSAGLLLAITKSEFDQMIAGVAAPAG